MHLRCRSKREYRLWAISGSRPLAIRLASCVPRHTAHDCPPLSGSGSTRRLHSANPRHHVAHDPILYRTRSFHERNESGYHFRAAVLRIDYSVSNFAQGPEIVSQGQFVEHRWVGGPKILDRVAELMHLVNTYSLVQPTSTVVNNERLRLTVAFSTTTPLPDQQVDVTAHIERIGFQGYGMMIGEIGLPPGADVDRASLESAAAASDYQLNHYEVLPDKVLIYGWPRAGGLTMHFHFRLRYAIDALTAPSSVYDYYNPDARFDLKPTRIRTR